MKPTRTQEAILRWRSQCHILSSGTRGSAKTVAMMLDILDRVQEPTAHPLVVRESHAGLLEIQDELHEMFVTAFGHGIRSNKSEGQVHLPNGATVTYTQLNDVESYSKHQGKSYCSLYLDEFGNYTLAAMEFVHKLRSNLRVRPGIRPHIHATANPFGRAHARIMREHIVKAPFWQPYQDASGDYWVNTHTTYKDNPHIDRVSYEKQLIASANGDPNLLAAWEQGRWDVLGGSMFAPPFDPATHIIKAPPYENLRYRIGADFGLSAPSVGLLLGQLKDPVGYMRQGSIIVLDETDTCLPGQLHLGDGSPPQVLADLFKEMLARNNASPRTAVCIDDMRGLNNAETVVTLLRQNQITAYKPYNKNRVQGWVLVRSLLHNAVTREGPGMWITDRCTNLLQTLPEAPRNPNRPSDLDPRWNEDHHCDALSYGTTDLWGRRGWSGTHIGMF